MDLLVSTDWLAAELGAPDLRVLDATGFLPASGRDARAEYEAAHVPGAARFDIDAISDPDSTLPHMLPSEHLFASRVRVLGIGDSNRIVVYDNSPLHSAFRAWWMLKTFGARHVAVVDGGLQKWMAEGRPVESGVPEPVRGHFTPQAWYGMLATKDDIAGAIDPDREEIVDACSRARFAGEEPEPRAGVEAGHIPGSKNLPQNQLFNPDNTMKRGDDLRAMFEEAGVDLARPLITTCGSGVTAAVLLFGARLLGKTDVRLYDGSWAEWGSDPFLRKAKGAA
jgi:thiosulfate/3-mercaptopyruvate sulfurtransferase